MKHPLLPYYSPLIVLLVTLLHSVAAPAPLPIKSDHWFGNPLTWTMTAGNTLVASGERTGLMEYRKDPISKHATVKADITVQKAVGDEWKIAAVALAQDSRNFWHVALVEAPDASGGRHAFELAEMREGRWLAHHNLLVVSAGGTGEPWKNGETYRLTLTIDPSGIEGKVQDAEGGVRLHRRISFSGPAVTTGRPALRCGGFQATYTSIRGDTRDPVMAPRDTESVAPYACDSFARGVRGNPSGFFHVEKQGNLWWVIDPLGRGFVPLGIDHVRYSGHWCSALGYHPHEKKNDARYANREAWAEETLSRLTGWGFNLLTAGNDTLLHRRGMAHTIPLNIGQAITVNGDGYYITPHEKRPCTAFPNVFHPDFERFCRYEAERECARHADDPWLFGYFLDNELAWWGRSWGDFGREAGLFDAVMKLDADHTAKLALRNFVRESFDSDIDAFNAAFGVGLHSFDEITGLPALDGGRGNADAVMACKGRFARLVAETYFGAITRAIRAADPNHMILGCRFADGHASSQVWEVAGKYCDICTFNYYGNVDLDRGIAVNSKDIETGPPLSEVFAEFYDMGGRPMMVTEWSFPALDAGLPSTKGAGQRFRTQTERATASGIFAETTLRMPFMVGYDYFMWVDEPTLGITPEFPENSNYGLINEDGVPYARLVDTFTSLHRRAAALRQEGLKGLRPAPPARNYAAEVDGWLKSVKKRSPGPHPDLYAHRNGDRHIARTKRFEIRTRPGDDMLTEQIFFDGTPLGRFNGMLQVWTPSGNRWHRVNHLKSVGMSADQNPLTMLLTGTGPSEAPFEVAYRLTLLPSSPWFLAEFISAKNTGERPLDIRGVFFRPHSAIGDSPEDDLPIRENMAPRLWGRLPGDAWVDAKVGVFWGATAPRGSDVRVNFWLNNHGGQHPDARREIQHILDPGETYRPDRPTFVAIVAGRGGAAEWDHATAAVARE